MNTDALMKVLYDKGPEWGMKVIGAVLLWVIGKWLVGFAMKLTDRALVNSVKDTTIRNYVTTALKVMLMVALVTAILGYLGMPTTSFAAMIAAAGLAVGMAWSGLLANFAAGVFLVLLRPIKLGDYVMAGGVEGTVKEIGLFVTKIDTPDRVEVIVANNKIFSENITNYSTNPLRRVNLVAQLSHGVDPEAAIAKLKPAIKAIANTQDAEADIFILEFNLAGPVLCVRPFTNTANYWQVYFDTNMAIRKTFGEAGYPVPEKHYHLNKAA